MPTRRTTHDTEQELLALLRPMMKAEAEARKRREAEAYQQRLRALRLLVNSSRPSLRKEDHDAQEP